MKSISASIFLILLCATFSNAHAVELKIATLAPQGSAMYNELDAATRDVSAKTGNRVTIKIFGGGVQGDEKDVVRKMRYGQLSGAALTGVGLGLIDPQIRVLELPFLFKDASAVDRVYDAMKDYFIKAFDQKGFVLLGWAEVGFVKIFSNGKAITTRDDLKGMKMWMWEGDPLAEAMYQAMGVTPVPLAITDVLTSLQTKLIDAAYAPELGAIAFQWHTKVKYMTDVNLVNGTGAILLSKAAWNQLGPADRSTVRQVITDHSRTLVARTRADNTSSKSLLEQSGIKIVNLTPAALTDLQSIGRDVQQKLVGRLYSKELLDKVLTLAK